MWAWLVGLVVFLAAGCAEFSHAPADQALLGPPLQRFTAEGRISLRQGDRRDHLRFSWDRSPGKDVVLLMTPLGQGLAELTRDADGARLVQPTQAPVSAGSLAQLAQRAFGMPVPLDAMADWLRGAQSSLSGEIDGWRVAVTDTSPFRERRLLRVMEARRNDVELTLIIDDWEVRE